MSSDIISSPSRGRAIISPLPSSRLCADLAFPMIFVLPAFGLLKVALDSEPAACINCSTRGSMYKLRGQLQYL
jgi:hypothetical protein